MELGDNIKQLLNKKVKAFDKRISVKNFMDNLEVLL